MSRLEIRRAADGAVESVYTEHDAIAAQLSPLGVRFEQWQASAPLSAEAGQDEVLAAYREPVERLTREYGFQSVDVVSLRPDHPQRAELRGKFLSEHVHADFEVRFFVDGSGLFYLHIGERIYLVLCEQGDLISVPANTPHWFDMGEHPDFKCIRLFTVPDGWVAQFTGSGIAAHFPSFDQFVAA
ncbi:1,2-dihydroxy-3-keto-5-methylthiopentene dioxygenase [Sulfurivermis fontis]|uniref:1,2-dihydroxy-3-keto-5-methylthiopentene dioxygenase n=1 Tax=Sulfurivermis fontis TaxID=1972068 RepID=UPI000FD838C2|nr:cupin [Sulfurivermis fontis]